MLIVLHVCSRTPNHLPKWFTHYGCFISPNSPISGGASSQYGLDITMAWNSSHLEWARSGLHLTDRMHPNHGKFVCDTIRIWHSISRHYLGIVGSRGLWFGNRRAADALAAQNIAGIVDSMVTNGYNFFKIFASCGEVGWTWWCWWWWQWWGWRWGGQCGCRLWW